MDLQGVKTKNARAGLFILNSCFRSALEHILPVEIVPWTLSPAQNTKHTPCPVGGVNIHEIGRGVDFMEFQFHLLHHCCSHVLLQLVPLHPPGHKDKHHALEVMIHTSCH